MKEYLGNIFLIIYAVADKLSLERMDYNTRETWKDLDDLASALLDLGDRWEAMDERQKVACRKVLNALNLPTDLDLQAMAEEAEAIAEMHEQKRLEKIAHEQKEFAPGGEL